VPLITEAKKMVELDRVSLRYGGPRGVLALKDASLTIREGEFTAVVGPSGCGKSSLMKLVTGLLPTSEGTISVDGKKVSGPLKIVGMAFQNPTLLPWRNTLRNVMLPLEVAQQHRNRLRHERAAYEEKALALLATVGLRGFEKQFPWGLSGGMQQRANLCRSLIHEPKLLMLDEPFGALDSFTREELWVVLQDLWMAKRFTCILVTHDLREAAFLADKIVVMSSRPARVLAVHNVPLPRARRLDDTYSREFVALTQQIREEIAQQRQLSIQGAA
jgi:NitT/TauT family transport system ATP-binding protein